MLHLRLLGTFRAQTAEGLPLRFQRRKSEALVAFLALHPGPHSREKLAALFGGDGTDDDTRRALRVVLTDVRKVLGEASLESDRDTLALRAECFGVLDTVALERHLRQGELDAALALCQGELLEGIYDDWVLPLREHYRRLVCEALETQVGRRRSVGDYPGAIAAAQRLLALDPANEPAHQHLMVCYAASGDRQSALAQYESCRAALEKHLGTRPSKETQALWQGVQKQAESTPVAALTNLPRPLTSFIGREEALEEIETLLTQARLVTLTGMGGHGKTRLAIQAAEEGSHAFPDGVWWVELASLTEEGQLEQAVARVLGVKERGGNPLRVQVAQAVGEKRLLLVLDNAEHLLATCADTVEYLLGHCHGLTVLATSRAPLGVPGEIAWAVPPLTVPTRTELKYLKKNEAVQFFIERGRTGGLQLSDENAATVAALCQRLEGIPLALELAAAQLRTQSLEQLAGRIQTTLEALVSENPTHPPRQRTLHALVAWSYGLLNPVEQALFRRFSVFVGSASQEAATVVAGGYSKGNQPLLPPESGEVDSLVLPITGALLTAQVLESLADKSLLRRFRSEQGVRYGMLETLRSFALTQLAQSGEQAPVRQRHARYFQELLIQGRSAIYTTGEADVFAGVEQEISHLREVLRFQTSAETWFLSHQALVTLTRFWYVRGYYTEGCSWLTQLTEHSALLPLCQERGELANSLGLLLWQTGRLVEGRHWFEQALALYESLGILKSVSSVLNNLGCIANDESDYLTAEAFFARALALSREVGHTQTTMMALNNLANILTERRDFVRAEALLLESLALRREHGDIRGVGIALNGLGDLAAEQEHFAQARRYFTESLQLRAQVQDRRGALIALLNLVRLDLQEGQLERAGQALGFIAAALSQLQIQLSREAREAEASFTKQVESALGEPAFTVSQRAGAALSLEEIVARFALGATETDGPVAVL